MYKNVVILGASSSIAQAIINQIHADYPDANIFALSRKVLAVSNEKIKYFSINYDDEFSIEKAANLSSQHGPLDLIFVANGILHDESTKPEKSIRDFSISNFEGKYPAGQLVLELEKDVFKGKNGTFIYSDAFNLDPDKVTEFDSSFPYKEKHWQPSQEVFSIAVRSFLEKPE